jgi:cation diffusion facilitator family transporter
MANTDHISDDEAIGSPVKASEPSQFVSSLAGGSPKGSGNGAFRYQACEACAASVGTINIAICLLMMLLKGYLGIVGGSRALLADAIHSSADLLSAMMMVFGLRIAGRPADERYSYGYGKIEYLMSILIYALLFCVGVIIIIEALFCIIHQERVDPSAATFGGALISIIVCELMFRQGVCAGTQLNSPSMVANAWEKRTDAITSIAVLFGILGAKLGFPFLDPLAAIVVGGFILKFSVGMLSSSVKQLLDRALAKEIIEGIRRSVALVPGVRGVAQIRSREMGHGAWVDIEVLVDGEALLEDVHRLKDAVRRAVNKVIERPSTTMVFLKPLADGAAAS